MTAKYSSSLVRELAELAAKTRLESYLDLKRSESASGQPYEQEVRSLEFP